MADARANPSSPSDSERTQSLHGSDSSPKLKEESLVDDRQSLKRSISSVSPRRSLRPRTANRPHDWFQQLFGAAEYQANTTLQQRYAHARSLFQLEGNILRSLPNDRRFCVGEFSCPTLGELRKMGSNVIRGPLTLTHEVIGDVIKLHALDVNRGALFQVASQLNCLEFSGPTTTPEHGVTDYCYDPTQGPACALAAPGATVFRNYFVDVNGQSGQTSDCQINNLDAVAAALGGPDEFWSVRNGYVQSTEEKLKKLAPVVRGNEDKLTALVKIGLQTDIDVSFAGRFEEVSVPTHVSQAFCSAISVAYSGLSPSDWEPIARILLDGVYESTLWAAALSAARGGSNKVFLTFVGGGAFGNRREWIASAIAKACHALRNVQLQVCVAHFGHQDGEMRMLIEKGMHELQHEPRRTRL